MGSFLKFLAFTANLLQVLATAPSGPWDAFNLAPNSRTVYAATVHGTNGNVANAGNLLSHSGAAIISGNGSYVTLDFGKEVGGLISLNFANVSASSSIVLSFTESPSFIRPYASDDSSYPSATTEYDGVLSISSPLPTGYWTQPAYALRGGFRYLTIVSTSNEPVSFSNLSCAISFSPASANLQDYSGYFYAEDPVSDDKDFLTKAWFSGAYTVQTNVVPLNTGRQIPQVKSGWANNATLGVAGPIIVDGAKRDRAVWPGDMGVAVPTAFVSTNDLLPVRNALSSMFAGMNAATGALPESGPPLSQQGSDTYHMWTLIGTYNYYLYTGDSDWLQETWSNYTKGVAYIAGKINSTGLVDVTGLRDWGRLGQGGYNAEANAIYYKLLTNSVNLATWLNDTTLAAEYSANATVFKVVYNSHFWDANQGMYIDNSSTTLTPQDANSFAVLFNLTQSEAQAKNVSTNLQKSWGEYGAVAPELPDNISPFIGSFELQAHFEAGNDEAALDLLRKEWGYMLTTNLSVQSTWLEGYTTNGSLFYRSYDGYYWDPAYTSHSHGWSSGPTSALTYYVLGLTVTSPQGATWSVAPHLSGLSSAQGGFETPLGWFGVNWNAKSSTSGRRSFAQAAQTFTAEITTPSGTTGTVALPFSGTVTVDGKRSTVKGNTLTLSGGKHTVTVQG